MRQSLWQLMRIIVIHIDRGCLEEKGSRCWEKKKILELLLHQIYICNLCNLYIMWKILVFSVKWLKFVVLFLSLPFFCEDAHVMLPLLHFYQVALKILIVIHRLLREGDPTFREELLNFSQRGHILQLSNFKDDSSPIGNLILLSLSLSRATSIGL